MPESKKEPRIEVTPHRQLSYQRHLDLTSPEPPFMTFMHKGYDNVSPGAAELILNMAAKEQAHQHQQEQKRLDAQINDSQQCRDLEKTGASHAIIFALTVIIFSSALIYTGHTWGGGIFGASGLAGVVTAFLGGRRGAADTGSSEG